MTDFKYTEWNQAWWYIQDVWTGTQDRLALELELTNRGFYLLKKKIDEEQASPFHSTRWQIVRVANKLAHKIQRREQKIKEKEKANEGERHSELGSFHTEGMVGYDGTGVRGDLGSEAGKLPESGK